MTRQDGEIKASKLCILKNEGVYQKKRRVRNSLTDCHFRVNNAVVV